MTRPGHAITRLGPIWAPNLGPYLGRVWALGANHPEPPDDLQPGPDESSQLKYKPVYLMCESSDCASRGAFWVNPFILGLMRGSGACEP